MDQDIAYDCHGKGRGRDLSPAEILEMRDLERAQLDEEAHEALAELTRLAGGG
jgi:hypothetical protein